MSNKSKSIYFVVLAVLYFAYTVFIVKHGIHWTNTIITSAIFLLSGYYYIKNKKTKL